MTSRAPGKSYRTGITMLELGDLFPNEEAARAWFEARVWLDGRFCPHCGSRRTHEASHKKSPYRCSDCRHYFSVKTGTALEASRVSLRKWAFAIYLEVTSLKGVSSMKLHRDLGVTQKTAWFMLHRLRETWADDGGLPLTGPVEADEMYLGGRNKNKPISKREHIGGGPAGKQAVVGVKDRATGTVRASALATTDWATLRHYVEGQTAKTAVVYTDEHPAYRALPRHAAVRHSAHEYVVGEVHTNGIESFWSMFKRGYYGTFHRISPKHVQRYLNEFTGRHGIRDADTIDQMHAVVAGMVGKRLMYRDLIAAA